MSLAADNNTKLTTTPMVAVHSLLLPESGPFYPVGNGRPALLIIEQTVCKCNCIWEVAVYLKHTDFHSILDGFTYISLSISQLILHPLYKPHPPKFSFRIHVSTESL